MCWSATRRTCRRGSGIHGPGCRGRSRSSIPSAFFGMMDQVAEELPNIKIVATTLREVHSTNRHGWSAVAWINGKTLRRADLRAGRARPRRRRRRLRRRLLLRPAHRRIARGSAEARLGPRRLLTTFPGDTTMATLGAGPALRQGRLGADPAVSRPSSTTVARPTLGGVDTIDEVDSTTIGDANRTTRDMAQADFGLIGLAVMGENLALNIEEKGLPDRGLQPHDRQGRRVHGGRAKGKKFIGCHSLEELVQALERPRRIIMMVKAGEPVDELIASRPPLLEQGRHPDRRRQRATSRTPMRRGKAAGGARASTTSAWASRGGEEGALTGPSIMPGGQQSAYDAARADPDQGSPPRSTTDPCCRLHRAARRRPLREDGPQRHRVRRHAAHLRGLRPAASTCGGLSTPRAARGLRRLEPGRAAVAT